MAVRRGLEHFAVKRARRQRTGNTLMVKASSHVKQPRLSKAFRNLQKALGLDEADWQAFLSHARDGFADYDCATSINADPERQIEEVPDSWLQDPSALGHVTVRVLKEGEASLMAPVARFFLGMLDGEPDLAIGAPGIGLAWLHLARQGLAVPLETSRLVHFALDIPEDFFAAVAEDDLLPLCRLVLEGHLPIEAWDLDALFVAVDRAAPAGARALPIV